MLSYLQGSYIWCPFSQAWWSDAFCGVVTVKLYEFLSSWMCVSSSMSIWPHQWFLTKRLIQSQSKYDDTCTLKWTTCRDYACICRLHCSTLVLSYFWCIYFELCTMLIRIQVIRQAVDFAGTQWHTHMQRHVHGKMSGGLQHRDQKVAFSKVWSTECPCVVLGQGVLSAVVSSHSVQSIESKRWIVGEVI